jgi:diguanylate cyclase (GGDEF)-like protein
MVYVSRLVRGAATRPLVGFAVLSAGCVVLLGLALGSHVSAIVERRTVDNAAASAATVMDVATQALTAGNGVRNPVAFEREIQVLAKRQGVTALQLVSPAARVVLFGRMPHDPNRARALHDVLSTNKPLAIRVGGDYLIHLPILLPAQRRPQAMVVASLPTHVVLAGVDSDRRSLYTLLAGGLALLWATLLPIVWHVSRKLRRQAEENERLARFDGLTGLANRSRFYVEAEAALERGPVGAIVIDVDGFKGINDTFGHAAGDEVLRALGMRLRSAIREQDAVGRVGGDEFAALIVTADLDELDHIAERVVETLSAPVSYRGSVLQLGVSVGVAASGDGERVELERLLREADRAMYRAKRRGGRSHTLERISA